MLWKDRDGLAWRVDKYGKKYRDPAHDDDADFDPLVLGFIAGIAASLLGFLLLALLWSAAGA